MSTAMLLILAVGLSLDAFAAAIASGFAIRPLRRRDAVKVALYFGGFQALMPLIGWCAGTAFRDAIRSLDHWVAFGLLAVIGLKMIYESVFLAEEERMTEPPGTKMLFTLAVATSLDALAVGVSLAALQTEIVAPALVIGLVTFTISLVGVVLGHHFGHFFESKIGAVAGLVLLGIGLKILLEHMGGGS